MTDDGVVHRACQRVEELYTEVRQPGGLAQSLPLQSAALDAGWDGGE